MAILLKSIFPIYNGLLLSLMACNLLAHCDVVERPNDFFAIEIAIEIEDITFVSGQLTPS